MTLRSMVGVLVAAAVVSACTQRTPEMALVHEVAEALGGASDLAEAQTLVLEGEGRQYRLGQNHAPGSDLTYWDIDDYRQEVDFQTGRLRVTQVRTSRYLTGNPSLKQPQTYGLDGEVAYAVSDSGEVDRLDAHTAEERRIEYYHHPATLVHHALQDEASVANLRQEDGQDVVDVISPEGETYSLYVDPETRQPSRIVSTTHHPTLGDVTVTTTFVNYRETGSLGGFRSRLIMPRQIATMIDDWVTRELTVSTDYDQEVGDLAAPEAARAADPPAFSPEVQVAEVAEGVWHLAGQSHHSVLVEFDEFLVLIEAPQHDARTLAVIEQAEEIQPDKPVRYVVNTHHHYDHAGGVRAAVSAGLTLVTHEVNEAFFRDLVGRSRSRQPDALSRNPAALQMELVQGDEVFEIEDGRVMQVARITGDPHCAGNLMVYLPEERILIQADAYSPGSVMAPFAPNLLEAITAREWEVDRVVPIHGDVFEMSVLEDAVQAETERS